MRVFVDISRPIPRKKISSSKARALSFEMENTSICSGKCMMPRYRLSPIISSYLRPFLIAVSVTICRGNNVNVRGSRPQGGLGTHQPLGMATISEESHAFGMSCIGQRPHRWRYVRPVRLMLRGGCKNSENDVEDEKAWKEIADLAEDIRRRIPGDEELKSHAERARVGMERDRGAVEDLRRDLASFQIDVEGEEDDQGVGLAWQGNQESDGDCDEGEDEYGPSGLLKSFWALEAKNSMGVAQLRRPEDVSASCRAKDFAVATYAANAVLFDMAQTLPALCGADKIFSLPDVEKATPVVVQAIKEASAKLLESQVYRQRLERLLLLCVDGYLCYGYASITAGLEICLPVSTTARIMSVLQREKCYFADYWTSHDRDFALRLEIDEKVVRKVLARRSPGCLMSLEQAPKSISKLVKGWMSGHLIFGSMALESAMCALSSVLTHGSDELLRLTACAAVLSCAVSPGASEIEPFPGQVFDKIEWEHLTLALGDGVDELRQEIARERHV